MKKYAIVLLVCLGGQIGIAQSSEPLRAFLSVDTRREKVQVVSSPSSVYVVKSAAATTDLSVVRFDSLLQEVWALRLQRSLPQLSMVKAADGRLFLLMSSLNNRALDVLELDEETGHYFLSSFTFSRPFQLRDFEAYREHMWCSGAINGEGIAFSLESANGGVKALPVGFLAPILEVADITFDTPTRELHLTLRSTKDQRLVAIRRVFDLEGKMLRNDVFESPGGYNIKDFQYGIGNRQLAAVASFYKGNSTQLKGLTTWHFDEADGWSAVDHPWEELPGVRQRYDFDREDRLLSEKRNRWENGGSRLAPFTETAAGLLFAIDRFEKQYNVRGALQREQDQEILVNQLDQNQFGRRGFDVNESTLDSRVETFSNTDFSTYQFRDVLVGSLEEAGNSYVETWAFMLDSAHRLRGMVIGVGGKTYGPLADGGSPVGKSNEMPVYFVMAGERLDLIYLHGGPNLATVQVPMGPYSQRWFPGSLLNFGFLSSEESIYLFLQRYDFEEWAVAIPESQGR